jgi:hypothetical protein
MRDEHVPDTLYVKIETYDDDVVELNKAIRSAEMLHVGQRFTPVDEHAELTAQFQFPSHTDYQLARESYPDIFSDLEEGGDVSIRAGEKLAVLFPQYVTMVKLQNRVHISRGE